MHNVCSFIYGDCYTLKGKGPVWTGYIEPASETAALLVEPDMTLQVGSKHLHIVAVERFAHPRPGNRVGILLRLLESQSVPVPKPGEVMHVLSTPKCGVCGTRTKQKGGDPDGPSPYDASARNALERKERATFPYKCPVCGRLER